MTEMGGRHARLGSVRSQVWPVSQSVSRVRLDGLIERLIERLVDWTGIRFGLDVKAPTNDLIPVITKKATTKRPPQTPPPHPTAPRCKSLIHGSRHLPYLIANSAIQ